MKALIFHDSPEKLLEASRRSRSGRVSHRLLAIRDIMLGQSRMWVCGHYGVSRENLRHWISWYNDEGMAGLEDGQRAGRRPKLSQQQRESLKARISLPPDIKKDGVGRWRAVDVQQLIEREYGITYRSITHVCALLRGLGQSWISGRPKHPRQEADAVASFKKTRGEARRNQKRASRQND